MVKSLNFILSDSEYVLRFFRSIFHYEEYVYERNQSKWEMCKMERQQRKKTNKQMA